MTNDTKSIGQYKTLAVVTPYFWPEVLGCAPHMTDLARFLARRGHQVEVFTAVAHYPRKPAKHDLASQVPSSDEAFRIARAWVFDRSVGSFSVRLWNDLLFTVQTAYSATRRRWNAVLILAPTGLIIPGIRLLHPKARLVAAVYDIESKLASATNIVSGRFVSAILDWVETLCLNRADIVLALTPQMKSVLEDMGINRPIIICPIWPSIAPAAAPTVSRPPTLMYCGGLARRHGIEMLPRLWRELQRCMPECHLIVQGDGGERDRVTAALLEIGGNVTLKPTVDQALLAESLRGGDLQIVLTGANTANYSIPSKAISALAAGVPFLTNAPEGSALFLLAQTSGGGIAVPNGSPEAMARAAADLLASTQQRRSMAELGLDYVRRVHSRETILNTYEDLLLEHAAHITEPCQ